MPERDDRHVLLATLHGADMGAVYAHLRGQRVLADAGFQSVMFEIAAKCLTNIHPQAHCGSRILVRRIIIRDATGPEANHSREPHNRPAVASVMVSEPLII